MKKIVLPYATAQYFSKAMIDYLNEAETIKPYYEFSPQLSVFPEVIEKRKLFDLNRDVLHDVLVRQYTGITPSKNDSNVFENIHSLKESNTFTVTVAHQPSLFLGPLYLIYKTISAINLSKKLNEAFPAFHFVPMFWMGSEDHDKEELNHIHLFGKTFTWDTPQQGAFGRMKTESLKSIITEIKNVLGEGSRPCIELLEACYLQEETIAAATRKILHYLFAKAGLVIVDGDDRSLKKLFIPIFEKELFQQVSFPIVQESNLAFSKNYDSQINPREINLFYLDDGIRQRIVKEGDRWQVLNTDLSFSKEEIKARLLDHPENFSPNVVLRPVYQEMVLPNVCFLGGGSEITYWMQLKPLFEALNVSFPMVLLRNSVLWIDKNQAARMNKLSISAEEIFLPAETLIKKYLQKQSGDLISLDEERKTLQEILSNTTQRASAIDASLKGSFEAEKVKMMKSLDLMEEKLRRTVKKKEETAVQQIQSLKEKLFPENELQERYDNFLSYYSKYGDQFFEELRSHLDVLELQFTILMEE